MGQRRKNEETVPEEETGGKFEPVAKLSNEQVDSKSGEENETAKFTIRSKLMEYDSKIPRIHTQIKVLRIEGVIQ